MNAGVNRPLRVALATCADKPELDIDDAPLLKALAARGIEFDCLVWDDPEARWDAHDVVLIRTTWDYWKSRERREVFLAWAARTHAAVPVWNGPDVLRENTHKAYLRRLEAAGVPVVPTLWLPAGDDGEGLAARLSAKGLSSRGVVIKPAVSAGSVGALRVDVEADAARASAHARELAANGEVLVQPYLRSIEAEGELSVIFFDGAPSHAVRKIPRAGDFRSQPEFESDVSAVAIAEEALAVSRAAFSCVESPLLYGRVDLVRRDDGALCVIELELTEPSLYLRWDSEAADRLVGAIARRGR